MRRALLSVSDKTGLLPFARALHERGFELVSTGGTAGTLASAGLPVRKVADLTGFPEMMDGRVKTLHPAIHGGILARRDEPADLAAAAAHGIGLIDVVCVNLYPFVQRAAHSQATFAELVEEIDIGGPTLIRAAAKNFAGVCVVTTPADYPAVLSVLDDQDDALLALRLELARKAFAHTAAYDAAIAATLHEVRVEDAVCIRTPAVVSPPPTLLVHARKLRDLRYGENPHQPAAWYAGDPTHGLGSPDIVQGKELSFTNLLDLDAALRIVREFSEPAACVVKHTNPCGAATGVSIADAYRRARDADALAAFGGIVGLNHALDRDTAALLVSTFIEAVVAPAVHEDARELLRTKPNLRVLTVDTHAAPSLLSRWDLRSVTGALLLQARDEVSEARHTWPDAGLRVVTTRQPTADEWLALRFAWRVMAHVKSNTVLFADGQQTRAIGAGQMSRVDAVKVAALKAAHWDHTRVRPLANTVAASDAFFPFRDGLDAVAAAGATAVVQPGGSVRDAEVIAAADEHGLAMVFTGRRHFRH